jgi:SAM-dependent methyltransferase
VNARGNCPLCGEQGLERMFPQDHPWLARCTRCRLGFADPQPTDEELAEIYHAEYYSQFGYQQGAADAALARIKRATYAKFLRQAERLLGPAAPGQPRRLLDVGCGLGYSLLAGEQRGWEAWGLEPHGMAGKGLPERLATRIVRGTLADYHLGSPAPLDLVSLIDVIEHVRDPVATIGQAGGLLRPGGVLMLATNSLSSRGARTPRWVHFHRAHLWYFSPTTLAMAVAKAGLQTRQVRTAWRVYNLQYVASILAAGKNSSLARTLARFSLKATPRFLRLMSWPPLAEGMLLLAEKEMHSPAGATS